MQIIRFEYRSPNEMILRNTGLRKYQASNSALQHSIVTYGFVNPVIVNEDDIVVCGENRVIAARALAMEEIPVIVVHTIDEYEIEKYSLVDNQVADMTGWNLAKKKKVVAENGIPKGMYGMAYELSTTENVDGFFTEDDTMPLFDL